jgi:hypothetical protein
VSNCPNLARTAAIEVGFSLNFAVIFDFIYFRFRPCKAKSIGNVQPSVVDPYSFFPDPDPEFDVGDQYGSRALMTKNLKKITAEKIK